MNRLACLLAGTLMLAAVPVSGQQAVQVWVTSGDATQRLQEQTPVAWRQGGAAEPVLRVDPARRDQAMVGFGAALTDASAILLAGLPDQERSRVLQDLFGPPPGIGLNFLRLTIGASDFSPQHYSLDDVGPGQRDPDLTAFSLGPYQRELLLVLHDILRINPGVMIVASPWSPPGWMKTSDSLIGGRLREDAYEPLARYFIRYLDAMQEAGIPVAALTIQNEPGFSPADYPGMRWDGADRARFIARYLGPLLVRKHPGVRLLDWDHNWDHPEEPLTVFDDAEATRFVDGVAWHCYGGSVSAQDTVRRRHPGKSVWMTECSGGDWLKGWRDELLYDIDELVIGSVRGGARGVALWNLALDPQHGPHHGGCSDCTGLVTIDPHTQRVEPGVAYYALGQASRFLHPGAVRIDSPAQILDLESVAFADEDQQQVVLVVLNPTRGPRHLSVRSGPGVFDYELPPRSVATFVWGTGQVAASASGSMPVSAVSRTPSP